MERRFGRSILFYMIKQDFGGNIMSQAAAQQPERRWTYNQSTGQLRDPNGRLIQGRGYSGAPGYINNPEAEGLGFRGPIPQGTWRIGTVMDRPRTGPFSIELQPDGHTARGRNGFFIHGESERNRGQASQGCPIFTRRQREAIRDSGVRRFDVVNEPEWQQ